MRKKAQGLSITTIIVAVIALVVLVVLVAIFTGRIGLFSAGLGEATSCEKSLNGICIATGQSCGDDNVRAYGAECPDDNFPVCCTPK